MIYVIVKGHAGDFWALVLLSVLGGGYIMFNV